MFSFSKPLSLHTLRAVLLLCALGGRFGAMAEPETWEDVAEEEEAFEVPLEAADLLPVRINVLYTLSE